MKKDQEGFTNPLACSAYFQPPFPFKNAQTIGVEFEVPREVAEAELPEPLEYVPGTAFVFIQDAQIASGASFHEGYVYLRTRYNGQNGWFTPYLFGWPEEAVLANRELFGWAEMMIDNPNPWLVKNGHTITGTLERRGELLVRASITLERKGSADELPNMDDIFTLKKIPSPLKNGKPLRQLVHIRIEDVSMPEMWTGRGALEFGHSSQFKMHRLQPKEVLKGYYVVINWMLPYAREVWDV
jgi:acetoacetate decarboxylase